MKMTDCCRLLQIFSTFCLIVKHGHSLLITINNILLCHYVEWSFDKGFMCSFLSWSQAVFKFQGFLICIFKHEYLHTHIHAYTVFGECILQKEDKLEREHNKVLSFKCVIKPAILLKLNTQFQAAENTLSIFTLYSKLKVFSNLVNTK